MLADHGLGAGGGLGKIVIEAGERQGEELGWRRTGEDSDRSRRKTRRGAGLEKERETEREKSWA